jgi:hypothetical protein
VASFDEVIPPGKAGSIRASIHTANYSGPIGKSITVTHDDPSQGPIPLGVTAKIVGSVQIYPYPALQLAPHRKGFLGPTQLIVRQDPTEKGTLAFDGLAASAKWLKATSRRVTIAEPAVAGLPAASPGDIVVSVQADGAPAGTHVEHLTFKTGLTREPKVTIPVTVSVQPAVTTQPNTLILTPTPESRQGVSGTLLVSVRDDLDPKTVAVTSDATAFAVRVDPPGERAFRLIVDWTGSGRKAPQETTIHIKVGTETVDVPVIVNLARPVKAS